MNTVLLYFAIPLLVIVVSVILEKLLNNPLLVAAFAFAVSLAVFFYIGNIDLLFAVILYAILALITALIVRFIKCIIRRLCERDNICDALDNNDNENNCGCNNRHNVRCSKHGK